MLIPGFVISILTFPGVIVHEMAHQLFCRILRVAVVDVCYLRLANPPGYVISERPKKFWHHVLIAIGPFFVNTALGVLITFPAVTNTYYSSPGFLDMALVWLGVSIATHAFPSRGDAKGLWNEAKGLPLFVRIAISPLVGFMYLGAIGSIFCLDLVYGVALSAFLPDQVVKLLI